jgi:hypothetical protein
MFFHEIIYDYYSLSYKNVKFLKPRADKNRQLQLDAKRDIVVPILSDILSQVILRSSEAMTSSRSFRVEWQQKYDWLLFEDGKMFCKLCINSKEKTRSEKKAQVGEYTI